MTSMLRPIACGFTAVLFASSCYLSRQLEAPGDAAVRPDAPSSSDSGMCSRPAPTTVRFEPPLPAGPIDVVALLAVNEDPRSDGIRFTLDICPDRGATCRHDAVIAGVGLELASTIRLPPSGARGVLEWDGENALHFVVTDDRRCASCGGQVEVVAGELVTPLGGGVLISDLILTCSTSCGDQHGVNVESRGEGIATVQGGTGESGSLLLHVSTDAFDPCSRCDCAFPRVPATGLFVSSFGVVRPGPPG